MTAPISINRAPVLTLWAAVVAERLGHDRDAALTLGKAVAGLNAQSKGRRLGIYAAPEDAEAVKKPAERAAKHAAGTVELLHRRVPVAQTRGGLRALERGKPASPEAVERYLESRFGEALEDARAAMKALARAFPKPELAEQAYALYEAFRPAIPSGARGWGAKGELDLGKLRALATAGAALPRSRPRGPRAAPRGRARRG